MQFKSLAVASLVAIASATPVCQAPTSVTQTATSMSQTATSTPNPIPADAKFGLMALRSGSDIHFAPFNAAESSVFLRLPNQNATCDAKSDGSATFYLSDGGLYLYSTSAPFQQFYADRSGMGQGKFGYTTGAQPPPRNAERTGWALDASNDLTLDGAGFIACPNSIDGAWSVWVSAGVSQPAGNSGCLGISVRAVEIPQPNSCLYTS